MAAVIVISLLAVGIYWHMTHRPKKVIGHPLMISSIGLHVVRNKETHKYVVNRIYPNSPAEKAGLLPGVILNKVNDSLAETNSLTRLTARLRGPVGTKVIVELIDTDGVTNEVELVRELFVNHSRRDTDK